MKYTCKCHQSHEIASNAVCRVTACLGNVESCQIKNGHGISKKESKSLVLWRIVRSGKGKYALLHLSVDS